MFSRDITVKTRSFCYGEKAAKAERPRDSSFNLSQLWIEYLMFTFEDVRKVISLDFSFA